MASIRRIVVDEPPVATEAATPPTAPPAPFLAPAAKDSVTLDGFVRSMLEPMLKAWLDANLPEIVENATHAEIRRLTGRND